MANTYADVILVVAEDDIDSATELESFIPTISTKYGKIPRAMIVTPNKMNTSVVKLISTMISKGSLLMPLFTKALMADKKCVLNIEDLVRYHISHTNPFGNFFYPIFFDKNDTKKFVPVFFLTWRGIDWFQREEKLPNIIRFYIDK